MRDLLERLRALFFRRQLDRELEEELRDHLARETEARRRAGSTAPERDALVALGGVEQTKEAVRDARGVQTLHESAADLRYAFRALRRNPGFTLTVMLVLGLGIGAATAVFAVVRHVLLTDLPYPEPDRLVSIRQVYSTGGVGTLSAVDALALQDTPGIFEAVGTARIAGVSVSGRGEPQRIFAGRATSGFFKALGVGTEYGRLTDPGEDRSGAAPVAVVTHAYAEHELGGARQAVGTAITLDGVSHTVIGVLTPDRTDLASFSAQVWTNLQLGTPPRRGPFGFRAVGRLRPGMTLVQATSELAALSRDLFPRWASGFQDSSARLTPVPLREAIVGRAGGQIRLFGGAVALVLLLAIVNVATLMLVRASAREHELSIRVALGADRGRLARLMLAECLALVVLAGCVALLVAHVGLATVSFVAPGLPRLHEITLDSSSIPFLVLAALLSGLLISIGPIAAVLGRRAAARPHASPARVSAGRRTHAVRGALVTAEFALALPLLLGAGLLANSFLRLQRVDPGFDPDGVLGLALSLPSARYDSAAIQPFWRGVEARVREVPGITAAGLSGSIPPDNGGDVNNFDLLDKPVPAGTSQPTAPWSTISNGYLTAMGIPLLTGRLFNEADSATAPPVVLVSRAWAAKYYPGADPLGRQMYNGGCTTCPPTTVVGVVGDVQYLGVGSDGVAVYMPLAQDQPRFLYLIARSSGAPGTTLHTIRTALGGIDGQIAPQEIIMTDRLHAALGDPRRWAVVVGGFALAGTVLAALGVFGLMSYVVRQRQREIGVRMALGATPDSVIWLVLSRGMRYALSGAAIGLVLSSLESHWLGSLLYGIGTTDPVTVAISVLILTIIAMVACLIPGLRAARIRPIEAISSD